MVKLNNFKILIFYSVLFSVVLNVICSLTPVSAANGCTKTVSESASGNTSTTRPCTPSEQAAYDAGIAAKTKADESAKLAANCTQRDDAAFRAKTGAVPCTSEEKAKITAAQQAADALKKQAQELDTKATPPPKEAATECKPPGIGWILCPVMRFTGELVDAAYSAVSGMLTTPSLNTNISDNTNSMYKTWSSMRSLANVIFVIVFIIIIFSQLTSAGISNYGIKKLLPKLIVAAVLVNISYFICAITVDISNIVGFGVRAIFESGLKASEVGEALNIGDVIKSVLAGSGSIAITAGATGTVIYGTVLFAQGWLSALTLLVPGLIAAFLAIATVFIILALRQAIIVLMIVVSPIAFVLYLLPNTESWFKKWKDMFTTMLMMFPIISAIFGASELAAYTVLRSSSDGMVQLMGVLIQFIPLAITPLVMKTAGGVLNKVGGFINNPNRGPLDALKNGSRDYRQKRQALGEIDALNGKAGRYNRFLRWNHERKAVNDSIKNIRGDAGREYIRATAQTNPEFLDKLAAGSDAYKIKIKASLDAEQMKAAIQSLNRELADAKSKGINSDDFLKNRAISTTHNSAEKSAAMNALASSGRDRVLRELKNGSISSSVDQVALQEAIDSNVGSLVNKAPDLIKGSNAGFNNITGNDLVKFSPSTANSYIQHLDSLYQAHQTSGSQEDLLKLQTAVKSYNEAMKDIKADTTLQASFGSELGESLLSSISSKETSTAFKTFASTQLSGTTLIDPTTKRITRP